MSQRTSTGQAAANALASYLTTQLGRDIRVLARWPQASTRAVVKDVTIVPVGSRRRVDMQMTAVTIASQPLTVANGIPTSTKSTIAIGQYEQNFQLDVWANSYDARDDIIDQLDDALTQGPSVTLGSVYQGLQSDPVRDGVLVALSSADGYTGIVDFLLDEFDQDDSPDSIQRSEYRATYSGWARGVFARQRAIPLLVQATLKEQVYEAPAPPLLTQVPYMTATLSPNATPPPAVKVTRGTSTT